MKKELVRLDALLLGGMSFYGDPISVKGGWDEENEIGKTARRFFDFISEYPHRPYSTNNPFMYEVHIYNDETETKGYFEIFFGEEVNTAQLPICLSSKYIEASDYLKVTLTGREITSDWWKALDDAFLASNAMKRNFSHIIQVYDERFKGLDKIEDSEMDVYVPLERI